MLAYLKLTQVQFTILTMSSLSYLFLFFPFGQRSGYTHKFIGLNYMEIIMTNKTLLSSLLPVSHMLCILHRS